MTDSVACMPFPARTKTWHSTQVLLRHLMAIGCMGVCWMSGLSTLFGQEDPWSETPYQGLIWFGTPDESELQGIWEERVRNATLAQSNAYFGSTMHLETESAPQRVLDASTFGRRVDFSADLMREFTTERRGTDKIFLVVLDRVGADRVGGSGYEVRTAEFDCHTQRWSSVHVMAGVPWNSLDRIVAPAIFEVFRRIGRITGYQRRQRQVTVVMRAGLLANDEPGQSPVLPPPHTLMYPVLRREQGSGSNLRSVSELAPWTMLRVEPGTSSTVKNARHSLVAEEASSVRPATDPQAVGEGQVTCHVDSGMTVPLNAPAAWRVERLALEAVATCDQTEFQFRDANPPHSPLMGYELFARRPGEKTMQRLGRTGLQGSIVVARQENPYRIYYVKYGNAWLAKIPFASGLQPHLQIDLVDQSERLRAEALVAAIQDELLDVAVKREIVAVQLRTILSTDRVSEDDIRVARQLLKKVKMLNQPGPLIRRIDRKETRYTSVDTSVQRRIDALFEGLRREIGNTLSRDHVQKLEDKISEAESRVAEGDRESAASDGS